MRRFFKILTFIILSIATKSYGQTNSCDTIYSDFETMPKYNDGSIGLLKYLTNELAPIIGDCIKRDKDIIASLHIVLTIDSSGKVIDSTFPKHNLTSLCKEDLKQKLLTMKGWTAGQKDGQPVCSTFILPVNCLKWQ